MLTQQNQDDQQKFEPNNAEYNEANDKTTNMNTLSALVNKVVKDGYTDSFKVTKKGLYSNATDKYFGPADIHVVNFYRFEGESDPADNAIMYVIQTTEGQKGTLIDAYGTYSDDSVNKFMQEVEDMNKKNTKNGDQDTTNTDNA